MMLPSPVSRFGTAVPSTTLPKYPPVRFGEGTEGGPGQPTASDAAARKNTRTGWRVVSYVSGLVGLVALGAFGLAHLEQTKKDTDTIRRGGFFALAQQMAVPGSSIDIKYTEIDGKTWGELRTTTPNGPVVIKQPVERLAGFVSKSPWTGALVNDASCKKDQQMYCLLMNTMEAELGKFTALKGLKGEPDGRNISLFAEGEKYPDGTPKGIVLGWRAFVGALPALQKLHKANPDATIGQIVDTIVAAPDLPL